MLRLLAAASAAAAARGVSPSVALGNAAQPGVFMPVMGLGTGGYGNQRDVAKPECWNESDGCGATSYNATLAWLKTAFSAGETLIRIDNADSYDNLGSVGRAMQDSGVPRANIFLTSKTGSPYPLGYDDTMSQFANVLKTQMVSYVDLLLSESAQTREGPRHLPCRQRAP